MIERDWTIFGRTTMLCHYDRSNLGILLSNDILMKEAVAIV